MTKQRLDQEMARRGLVSTRSQAESWIKLGKVRVNGREMTKPGYFVSGNSEIVLKAEAQYVSRAGLKLASVARVLKLNFKNKVVLDVGSSTGGFTDFALQHGAKMVYAVDVGTEQLHPTLRDDVRIELHEKTDIRKFYPQTLPDIVVIDVSFISVREILPHIAAITTPDTLIVAMLKPQFEAGKGQTSSGVLKNDSVRRAVLKEFEVWSKQYFVIQDKADSEIAGARGNRERFYLMQRVK